MGGQSSTVLTALSLPADGTYRLVTVATDKGGNRESPGTTSYLFIDRKPPFPKPRGPAVTLEHEEALVSIEFDEPVEISPGATVDGIPGGGRPVDLRAGNDTVTFSVPGGGRNGFALTILGIRDPAGNEASPVAVSYDPVSPMSIDPLDFAMGAISASSVLALLWAWSRRPASRAPLSKPEAGESFPGLTGPREAAPLLPGTRKPGRAERLATIQVRKEDDAMVPRRTDPSAEFDDAVRRLMEPSEDS
jgi:hypothetical protein